jgi:hypothetical protein
MEARAVVVILLFLVFFAIGYWACAFLYPSQIALLIHYQVAVNGSSPYRMGGVIDSVEPLN